MKTLSNVAGGVVGLCLLAGLAFGTFILVCRGVELFQSLQSLNSQLTMALGVASLLVLTTALSMRVVGRWIMKRDQAAPLRTERASVYGETLEFWHHALQAEGDFQSSAGGEAATNLSRIECTLILHASVAVVTAYLRFCSSANESGFRSEATHSAYSKLVGAMRSDLGAKPAELAGIEALRRRAAKPSQQQSRSNTAAEAVETQAPASTAA